MQTIPRLIRWIVLVALFFFILMFLLRLTVWAYFAPAGMHAAELLRSFWLGFRFDAREIGILCLLMLIIGSLPACHPFASRKGKRWMFLLLGIFLAWLIIFYIADFLHFRYLLQRLNASALSFL
jgi:hypothetical protein